MSTDQLTRSQHVDLPAEPVRMAERPLVRAVMLLVGLAVVVIGGLGSIMGAVVAGFLVGLVEAYGQAYVPALSQVLIFVLMAAVTLVRPAGLCGREDTA